LPVNAVAARLPAGNVLAVPGGHDWLTWRRLWDGFLAKWSREA
jgi:enterochelin esterase-like enzyme